MNKREERIAAVAAAWDKFPASAKPDLMLTHPDLYWAVARLAAHEEAVEAIATAERRARKRWFG